MRPGPEPPGVKRVLPKEKSVTQLTARLGGPAMHLPRETQSSAHGCSYDDGYGPLLWRKKIADRNAGLKEENMIVPTFHKGRISSHLIISRTVPCIIASKAYGTISSSLMYLQHW